MTTEEQVQTASILVVATMESRRRDPAFASIYPASWSSDLRTFANLTAQVAGLTGNDAANFATKVVSSVNKKIPPRCIT